MRRLLILSCSQRKHDAPSSIPAVTRYDGNAYRVLNKYLRERGDEALDIAILSAEFGLIPAHQPIPFYDRKMTPQRAGELQPTVVERLTDILSRTRYQSTFVACGVTYLAAFGAALDRHDLDVRIASGPIGVQLAQLKAWLYGDAVPGVPLESRSPRVTNRSATPPSPRVISDDVLQRARDAVAIDPGGAARVTIWRADVDGQPVPVKWLLHHLTGQPLKAFTSQTAVRELRRMGFEVGHE